MDIIDLKAAREFSPDDHVHQSLTATQRSDISIACWERGQTSPIHNHPGADEIYHVIEGSGVFNDGRVERKLRPGDTVIFPAGEVHQVTALTRMVLYRVQAGADRHPSRSTPGRESNERLKQVQMSLFQPPAVRSCGG